MSGSFFSFNQKLSFRLANYAVVLAFSIGLLLSAIQLFQDFKEQETLLDGTIEKILKASEPPASRAVHTLDPALAHEVVTGLMQYSFVQEVVIRDELGEVLAQNSIPHIKSKTDWLTQAFFSEEKTYNVPLKAPEYANIAPGKLKLSINPDTAFQPFYDRAVYVFITGFIRNLLLAILLIAVFYYALTKPLSILAQQFSNLDPKSMGDQRLAVPKQHQDTELGQLASAGNHFIETVQILLEDNREHHRAIARSEMRLNQLIDQVPQLIVSLDLEGDILFCNQSFAHFYNRNAGDLIGMGLQKLHSNKDEIKTLGQVLQAVQVNQSSTELRELTWTNPEGELCYLTVQIAPFEHFSSPALLIVASDISEQKMVQDHISHMANHDALTGLPNRTLLNDRLGQSLATCRRTGEFNALLFIDLDHFKTINDSLGHGIGDMLLKKVSKVLAANVRNNDTIARLGGDEFVVLVQSFQEEREALVQDVERVCKKLLGVLAEPFFVHQHQLRIGASIGVVIFPSEKETIEDLLRFADTAMYHAKENGRNCYAFYHEAMSLAVEKQRYLENQLHQALVNEDFKVHYQPLVGNDGDICGFEALIRWQHPKKGMISPAEFIPSLEVSGLIVPVSDWLISHCSEQIVEWRKSGFWQEGWYMSINISPQQFYQEDMIRSLKTRVESTGTKLTDICLEITENVAVESIEFTVLRLEQLREYGVKIALDDFGTGYSSLSYLKELPIDIVKIDRAFIKELGSDHKSESMVAAVCSIARAYSLRVTAEGVETQIQMLKASQFGCHVFQGFYIDRPQPAEEIEATSLTATLEI
ncbi:MAG: putative bifunctional diguanylate cyclase/phosphodiesterase [Neptuniibacter sp.]